MNVCVVRLGIGMFTIYIDTSLTKSDKNYGKIYDWLHFFYYGGAIISYFR